MTNVKTDSRSGANMRAAWYAVALLLLAYIISLLDRIVLSMMVDPIQQDLGLSDLQIGLIQGYVFAIFYALAGLPIGRLVDSRNRRTILAFGISFWGLMTLLSGFSKSFLHLFGARIGVAVGEAVLTPAAGSMLADYFPKEKLARAVSVYLLGGAAGLGLSFAIGGSIYSYLDTHAPLTLPILGHFSAWQLTFFVASLPALLLAPMLMTVREPERRGVVGAHRAGTLRDLRHYLYISRCGISCLFLFNGTNALLHSAFINWMPTVLIRRHNMSIGEIGVDMGIVVGVGAFVGCLGGGWVADYWLSKGVRDAHLRVALVSGIGMGPLAVGAALSPDSTWALIFTGGVFMCALFSGAAGLAGLQLAVPAILRGQVTALYLLVTSILGLGLGPLLVGFFTDIVFQSKDAIHMSLFCVSLIAVPCMIATSLLGMKPFGALITAREASNV